MHGRERKGKKKISPTEINNELSLFYTDDVKTQLLSSKGYGYLNYTNLNCIIDLSLFRQHSRQSWIEWVEEDLKNASNSGTLHPETMDTFIEIMICCLNEQKGGISIKAMRPALLSYLWCMGTETGDSLMETFKELFYSNYTNCRTIDDTIEWLSLMTIFLLSTHASSKEVDGFIHSFIMPHLEKAADALMDMDNENEDSTGQGNLLKEIVSSWMVLVSLIDEEEIISKIINNSTYLFTQLLEHEDIGLKILLSETFVIIASILDSFDYNEIFEVDLDDIVKEIRRIIYESDYELSRNDKTKILKFIEMIESQDFIASVDSIIIPTTLENTRHSIEDRIAYEKNKNKKVHPETGFAEAWIIEYMKNKLGHVFSELSNYELQSNNLRSTTGFSDLINSIISRNEVGDIYTLKIENLKQFGAYKEEHEKEKIKKEKLDNFIDY